MNLYTSEKKRGSILRKRKKITYSSKQYQNPFFQKKRAAIKVSGFDYEDLKFRIRFYVGFFLLVLIGGGAYLIYSNHFKIKNININGGGLIDTSKIRDIAWKQADSSLLIFLPQKNLFLFNDDRLLASLNEKYSFENITIEKKWPDSLNINYIEKSYSYIWLEDDKYFYVSISGDVISEANVLDIKQKDYPLINNLSDKKITENKVTVDQKYLDYSSKLWEKFKSLGDYKIDRFLIDKEINIIKIVLAGGPALYFNTEGDTEKQVNKLNIIRTEQLKNDFNKKQYIDLSVGDAVYFR